MKEYLKMEINIIKDNLSIIVLLPTFVGGTWQLFELSSISTSFIRFFSVGQLIGDGVLILFVGIFIYLGYKLVSASSSTFNFFKFNIEEPTPIIATLILTVLPIFGIFYSYFLFKEYENVKETGVFNILLLLLFLLTCIKILMSGIHSVLENLFSFGNDYFKKKLSDKLDKPLSKNFIKIFITITFCISVLIYIHFLNPILYNIRKTISFPNNLINKEELDKKLISDYSLSYKPELLYFNDKYCFYEIVDNSKNKKILILKFDSLINR